MSTLKSTIIFGLLLVLAVIGCEEVLGLGGLRAGTGGSGGALSASTGAASSGGGSTLSSSAGPCGGPCANGLECCGDTCIYAAVDPKNCGKCGVICATDAICSGSMCVCPGGSACGAGSVCCGSTCSPGLETDLTNCGMCGNACAPNETCSGSLCMCNGVPCAAGNTCCGGTTCSNLDVDPANCGSCGMACPLGYTCSVNGCSDWANWPMPNPVSTGLPNPASYDTGNTGYVIDKVTGRWWQQPIDGGNTAQPSVNCSGGCTQANAIAYCESLGLAGHSDWRVPTRIELVSIVDSTLLNPAINAAFSGTPAAEFWTSSPYVKLTAVGWLVDFFDGGDAINSTSITNRVRCVR